PRRAEAVDDPLAARLGSMSTKERERTLRDLVRTWASKVLGHQDQTKVGADRTFREIGFDSALAVEFRNALSHATGLRLPSSLVFDFPSPADVVTYISTRFAGTNDDVPRTGVPAVGQRLAAESGDDLVQFISDEFGIS
ncbi:acyl carrier protein, partial [Kibdelosporangium lantanae]